MASDKTRDMRREKREFEERTGGRSDLDKMRLFNAEKLMLNLMCEREVFKGVKERLVPSDFSEGLHRRLAEIIFATMESEGKVNPMSVISEFEPENIGAVSEILSDDKNVDNKLEAARMPFRIIMSYKQKQQDQSATAEGNTEKLQEIMDRLKKDKK